jgi:hypothetical protein
VRLSWLARGMGEAQGKKVSPPPLRPRRSRRSRPLARSSHQRPRDSRWSDSTEEEDVAGIEYPAQEAARIGRRKRNPCVQMGATECPDTWVTPCPRWRRVAPDRDHASILSRHFDEPPR